MTAKKKEMSVKNEKTDLTFTKSQIIESSKFAVNRDLLNVLLENEKAYTLKEVDDLIKDFKERKVN